MPMYQYRLINQGEVLATQVEEVPDDHTAIDEALDGMDPLELARDGRPATWVEAKHIYPDGRVSAHVVGAYEH